MSLVTTFTVVSLRCLGFYYLDFVKELPLSLNFTVSCYQVIANGVVFY